MIEFEYEKNIYAEGVKHDNGKNRLDNITLCST